jgi:hypothetical protein
MFVWGQVVDNKDPEGLLRVRVLIPGFHEPYHPQWAIPAAGFFSGHPDTGGSRPIPNSATVGVLFEQDDPDAPPMVIPAWPGETSGRIAGPPVLAAHAAAGGDPRDLIVVHDDEDFTVLVRQETAADGDKEIEIRAKSPTDDEDDGGRIVLAKTGGASKKALTLELHARTAIAITSKGQVTIDAARVAINGRIVAPKPAGTSI